MVLIKVRNSSGVVGRCDANCYEGIGNRCRCCCGGVNHGVGLNKAIRNTRNMSDGQILANFPAELLHLKITRPNIEPVLFE